MNLISAIKATQENDAHSWFVARIKPGEADRAIDGLQRATIAHSFPKMRFRNGSELPLIPGYVFVHIANDDDAFALVTNTAGIGRLLPIGAERPLAIPNDYMIDLHLRLASGEFDEVSEAEVSLPWFNKNERVAITSGWYAGHEGTFVRVSKGSVYLNVPFFGGIHEVPFKGHQVSKLN